MARQSGRGVCGPLCCQSYPDSALFNLIPIIGQMDDVLVVALGIKYLRRYVPQSVLDECENGSITAFRTQRILSTVTDPLPNPES